MANAKPKKEKTTTAKPAAAPKAEAAPSVAYVEEKPMTAVKIDMNQYITVRNGFNGKLIYKSKRTGEIFVWDRIGDEQEIELIELKNAKGSCKKMFTNNWFMFDDEWVIDYLGVRQYYKNALSIDEFDDVLLGDPDDIKDTISKLSAGQKRSLTYRAIQMVNNGEIDSRKSIEAIEKSLGVEIIEK